MDFCGKRGCGKALIAPNVGVKTEGGRGIYFCRGCGTELPPDMVNSIVSSGSVYEIKREADSAVGANTGKGLTMRLKSEKLTTTF